MNFKDYLKLVESGKDLDRNQARSYLGLILDDQSLANSDIQKALVDLTKKGETTLEILGLVDAMRERMIKVTTDLPAVDVCGTGGDRKGTFNISTASAIVLAAGGVKVAKHGNRSASSKFGSADVLEALGISLEVGPNEAAKLLEEQGFVFLFAQKYHPALKRLAMVRKSLGSPTVFNLLGPLLNPAGVRRQVIGTFSAKNASKLAEVAEQLDYEHLVILTSDDGLDEASLNSPVRIIDIKNGQHQEYTIKAKEFGLDPAKDDELSEGEDPEKNAQIVVDTLDPNAVQGARQRIVALNAGLGFYAAGQAETIQKGVDLAFDVIRCGKASNKLKDLRDKP